MKKKKRESEPFAFHPFHDLKDIMEKKGVRPSRAQTPKRKESPERDEDIFREAMKEVREIKEFRDLPTDKGRKDVFRIGSGREPEPEEILREIVAKKRPVRLSDTQEYVEWVHRGYSSTLAEMLHRGVFSVQDSLDLHGYTVDEAEAVIEHFLREVRRKGYRCVKIIHGRGLRSPQGPVLKKAVVRWLSTRFGKYVICFTSARQMDGGLGALYVLMK